MRIFFVGLGISSFYVGYSTEGEFDEYEFEYFLDAFFKKYGENVLTNNTTIEDVYNTFLPDDLWNSLTNEGKEYYKKELLERGQGNYDWFNSLLTFNEKGQVFCARAVRINNELTYEDFLDEWDGIGIYWSYKEDGAKTYYDACYGPTVIFKGWVNPSDIDWAGSIQTQSADELELRLNDGATVQVDEMTEAYTEKPLPLKGSLILEA